MSGNWAGENGNIPGVQLLTASTAIKQETAIFSASMRSTSTIVHTQFQQPNVECITLSYCVRIQFPIKKHS